MSYDGTSVIDEEDPLKKQQAASVGASGGANVTAGAAPTGGQAPQQAGAGPGGTGGWTNIQSYLDANKSDTGSAQALNKTVGDQFSQEKNAYTGDSQKFLTDAQAKVDQDRITSDQASGYIDQAASQYQYPGSDGKNGMTYAPPTGSGDFSGTHLQKVTPKAAAPAQISSPSDPNQGASYSDIVSKFQNALTGKYSGPKEYNYGFSGKTQDYGSGLKNDSGFDGMMNDLYSKSAGAPLTGGQFNLQKQIDVSNESLSGARKNLSSQYEQLGSDRDQVVKDTTAGLSGVERSYRDNQNKLSDYLTGKAYDAEGAIKNQEDAARASYNTDYTAGHSGKQSVAMDNINHLQGQYQEPAMALFRNRGIWGNDLTWSQLQNENNIVKLNDYANGDDKGNLTYFDYSGQMQPELDARKGMLDTFYGNEDKKYSGTADKEKRSYNAIQDFLNSNAAKRDQQFHVRG